MRKVALIVVLSLLTGCSWAAHSANRLFGGKSLVEASVNCTVQVDSRAVFQRKAVLDPDTGEASVVEDRSKAIFVFPAICEDKTSPVVYCSAANLTTEEYGFCASVEAGMVVKLDGDLELSSSPTLTCTYIREK